MIRRASYLRCGLANREHASRPYRLSSDGFTGRQRRPDPTDSCRWVWDLTGVKRVPYRLPELLTASPEEIVYIPEGEKDVETLRSHALLATTNPGGASSSNLWKTAAFQDAVRNRHVAILADNDGPGRAHLLCEGRQCAFVHSSAAQIHAPSGTRWRSPQRDPAGRTLVGLATPSGSKAWRRRACASRSASPKISGM